MGDAMWKPTHGCADRRSTGGDLAGLTNRSSDDYLLGYDQNISRNAALILSDLANFDDPAVGPPKFGWGHAQTSPEKRTKRRQAFKAVVEANIGHAFVCIAKIFSGTLNPIMRHKFVRRLTEQLTKGAMKVIWR